MEKIEKLKKEQEKLINKLHIELSNIERFQNGQRNKKT